MGTALTRPETTNLGTQFELPPRELQASRSFALAITHPSPKVGHSCRACPQPLQPHGDRALKGALGVAAALSGERGCRPFPRTPFPPLSHTYAKAAIDTGFLQTTATVNGLPVVSNQFACVRYSGMAPRRARSSPAGQGRAAPPFHCSNSKPISRFPSADFGQNAGLAPRRRANLESGGEFPVR